jgi:hypothetical protein
MTLNSQRDRKKIIDYPPSTLKKYEVLCYSWIDNLCFTIDPKECLDNSEEYIEVAKKIFLKEGWDGDGEVELMWVPPFELERHGTDEFSLDIVVWHVKRLEDGLSWILHPKNIFSQNS